MGLFKKNGKTEVSAADKRIYMANVSHEIRTPMNAIVGLSDILLKTVKDPEEREYLLSMQTATNTLLMTINNFLDYQGMLDGTIKICSDVFSVSDLIDEVIAIAKISIEEKNVKLLADISTQLPEKVKGDSLRIKQVLVHLLSNADKFTKEGYIKLTVGCEEAHDECKITFVVEDTGKGMNEDAIRRVFAPYEQENKSFTRSEGGLGIGLTIAKALVDLMKSELVVKSKPDVGTTVSFSLKLSIVSGDRSVTVDLPGIKNVAIFLPDKEEERICRDMFSGLGVSSVCLSNMGEIFVEYDKKIVTHLVMDHESFLQIREVKEVRDLGVTFIDMIDSVKQIVDDKNTVFVRKPIWYRDMAAALNGEGVSGPSLKAETKETLIATGARVLAVDDNNINLKVTKGLLRPFGLTVDIAGSAEEALKFITRTKYDIVFMDHMMPEMDGAEATRIIRQYDDPYYKNLPIIALSANAIEGAEEMFIQAGMNDFLAKPINVDELEGILKKWLPKEKVSYAVVEVNEVGEFGSEFNGFKKIDVAKGLSYTNGNTYMYNSLVKDFAMSIEDKEELIKKLAADEDVSRFTIEVHSLKSTSKILGAIQLSDRALELERLGHKRDMEAIKRKLPGLIEEIDSVIEDLKPFAKEEEDHVNKVPLDRDDAREKLRKLFYAADDFDYEKAKDLIAEISSYKYPSIVEELCSLLSDSIEDIDYDGTARLALEMLARI